MSPTPPGSVDLDGSFNASQSVAPYGVPSQPANQAFANGMEAVLMKTLGMNLSSITTSDNFPWPAIQIRDYFADHFGEQAEQPVTPNVPAFLLLPEQRVSPQLIPAAFLYRLSSLELLAHDQACTVVRNLDWLTSSFHLSRAERKALLWTYVVNGQKPSVVEGVLSEIQFANAEQAYAALSLLLDEPESDVASCFGPPCRLRGLRLIESHPWRYPLTLDSFFQSTVNLSACLPISLSRWQDIWIP
ncbi:hypothetical protein [Rhodoferax sp. PAMC 29310]|uniref:hypothetical protein n=1 Tax=Rhodoferax sp. PAMC 29310 TaxID=2822760 RepID=UPI001B32749E|nr:hypothetical protein [Rhodoferax sp. PAMC 29310]